MFDLTHVSLNSVLRMKRCTIGKFLRQLRIDQHKSNDLIDFAENRFRI